MILIFWHSGSEGTRGGLITSGVDLPLCSGRASLHTAVAALSVPVPVPGVWPSLSPGPGSRRGLGPSSCARPPPVSGHPGGGLPRAALIRHWGCGLWRMCEAPCHEARNFGVACASSWREWGGALSHEGLDTWSQQRRLWAADGRRTAYGNANPAARSLRNRKRSLWAARWASGLGYPLLLQGLVGGHCGLGVLTESGGWVCHRGRDGPQPVCTTRHKANNC